MIRPTIIAAYNNCLSNQHLPVQSIKYFPKLKPYLYVNKKKFTFKIPDREYMCVCVLHMNKFVFLYFDHIFNLGKRFIYLS